MKNKILRAASVVTAMSLLLAGCGNSSTASKGKADDAKSETETWTE